MKEGITTIVSVHENPGGARTLCTSGMKVAGDDRGFRITQKVLGHLGMFLNRNAERVLSVGFGSGSGCSSISDSAIPLGIGCSVAVSDG